MTTKCNDGGIATSSGADYKQGLTANKQVKKDDSPQISTTKCNDNVDTEDEELKKHTDTLCKSQKHEVSNSDSMLSNDDDFLVVAIKVTPPQPVVFSPLTAETQVEVRPLLNILWFSIPKVKFFGRGRLLKPFVHAKTLKIAGDGNCLFQAISYGISNTELYHTHVRREICNFIEMYDKDLKQFIKKGQGKMYIEGSQMQQLGTWGTEVEILVAAKIIHRDVYMYVRGTWQRFAYKAEKSTDAMFLDNRSGCHYNIVVGPCD